jgi:hypothetical protein
MHAKEKAKFEKKVKEIKELHRRALKDESLKEEANSTRQKEAARI